MICTFYITFEPVYNTTGYASDKATPKSVKATRMTLSRPAKHTSETEVGAFVMEFEVDIPEEQFALLKTDVKVQVPSPEAAVTALQRTVQDLS